MDLLFSRLFFNVCFCAVVYFVCCLFSVSFCVLFVSFGGSFYSHFSGSSSAFFRFSGGIHFAYCRKCFFYSVTYCFTMFFSVFTFLNVRLRRGNS